MGENISNYVFDKDQYLDYVNNVSIKLNKRRTPIKNGQNI